MTFVSRFKRIERLTPEQVEEAKRVEERKAADALKKAQAKAEAKVKKAEARGPYQNAIARRMEQTGRIRGVKLPDSPNSIAPPNSTTLYADSAKAGQFKQWSIWTEGKDVITEWGRTGSTLATKRKSYTSINAAVTAAEKTKRIKRMEGYRNQP